MKRIVLSSIIRKSSQWNRKKTERFLKFRFPIRIRNERRSKYEHVSKTWKGTHVRRKRKQSDFREAQVLGLQKALQIPIAFRFDLQPLLGRQRNETVFYPRPHTRTESCELVFVKPRKEDKMSVRAYYNKEIVQWGYVALVCIGLAFTTITGAAASTKSGEFRPAAEGKLGVCVAHHAVGEVPEKRACETNGKSQALEPMNSVFGSALVNTSLSPYIGGSPLLGPSHERHAD